MLPPVLENIYDLVNIRLDGLYKSTTNRVKLGLIMVDQKNTRMGNVHIINDDILFEVLVARKYSMNFMFKISDFGLSELPTGGQYRIYLIYTESSSVPYTPYQFVKRYVSLKICLYS